MEVKRNKKVHNQLRTSALKEQCGEAQKSRSMLCVLTESRWPQEDLGEGKGHEPHRQAGQVEGQGSEVLQVEKQDCMWEQRKAAGPGD
jgi:hypothetical protein